MKERIRHRFNPLHLYCRLMDCGMDRKHAEFISRVYEKFYAVVL